MRKRAVAGSILASMGILTAGWQIGAATATTASSAAGGTASGANGSPTPATTTTTSPTSSSSSTTTATPAPSATPTTSGSGLKDGAYTGTSEQTPYGNVQVKVTVSGGKITEVTAVHLTDQGGRSVQISNYAAPILRSEVLSSQSANVSNVGGATYTTDGYLSSVQSALDQAKS